MKKLIAIIFLSLLFTSHPWVTQKVWAASNNYYYGVFEDGQNQSSDTIWTNTINDLKAHNMNGILFTNNNPNLSISDSLGFNVIAAPFKPLYDNWYPTNIAADINTVTGILTPVINGLKVHPSLIGYNIRDDANPNLNQKFQMAENIISSLDSHPSSPLLVMTGSLAQEVYDYTKPKDMMGYHFPFKDGTAPCQTFSPTEFKDWAYILRENIQLKPQNDPLWLVLQAHQTVNDDGSPAGLRQPAPEELSLQFWEALGEEASGLFWYTYTNSVNTVGLEWTGLKSLPNQFAMAGTLGTYLNSLKPYLSSSQKIPDRFKISGNNYISTFQDKNNTNNYYVIAVNQNCSANSMSISSDYFNGTLKDVLTGETFSLGQNISFTAGGGRMLQVLNVTAKTSPAVQTNLVQNPSFENSLNNWSSSGQIQIDTQNHHTGNNSLQIGPSGNTVSQNINLTPNTYYYFSYWIKAQNLNANDVGMRVIETSPTVNYLTTVAWNQTGTFDWTKRIGYFKTTSDNTNNRIDIVWNLNAGQTFWVDDVILCRLDQPCPDEYLKERLTATTIPGDVNGDGKVDKNDYAVWLNNFGKTLSGPSNGDFNNDGKVNGIDYVIWLTHYSP